MADQYLNKSLDLSGNTEQTIYTVPTATLTNPPQDPVTAIIKNILVCNDSGSAATITVSVNDVNFALKSSNNKISRKITQKNE